MKHIIIGLALLIALSSSALAEWTQVSSLPDLYISDIVIQNDTVYLATLGAGVYRSVNNMESWDSLRNGLDSIQSRSVYQLLVDNPYLLIATQNGIYKSTNTGQNWYRSSDGIFVGNGAWYAFTESVMRIGDDLFTGAYTGIYRSSDGGDHWLATNISGDHVGAKAFTLHNGILFSARESINTPYAYKSTNGGSNWQNYNTLSMPTITYLSEPPLLWCGTIAGVWLSTNNGVSWEQRSNGLSLDPYNSSIIRVNGTLVTSVKFGGSGIYASRNDGVHWEDFGQGLPFLSDIEKLIVYGDKILAATSDGLYQRNAADVPTGVEGHGNNVPQYFALAQNYPNPFNNSTVIKFTLQEAGETALTLYDLSGRKVRDYLLGRLSPGEHSLRINLQGESSGVYFYKLVTGNEQIARRMDLIK